MDDSISRKQAIDYVDDVPYIKDHPNEGLLWKAWLEQLPSSQPERKTDIVQKFHDYQVEWLKSHYDIELEPQLEEMIVRFLHDTANCYMMEVEHES